jgi:hypothetical protein
MCIIYSFKLIQAYLLNVYRFLQGLRFFLRLENDASLKHAEHNTKFFALSVFGQFLILYTFLWAVYSLFFYFTNLRALLKA